jgi:NAD(P)-dependent dehydrogenase (short-subunit alcohol dehydrogenase family)
MPSSNTRMQGKVCLVTGANSGIGKATALGLARMGATVVMVCRDRVRGAEAQQEFNTILRFMSSRLAVLRKEHKPPSTLPHRQRWRRSPGNTL